MIKMSNPIVTFTLQTGKQIKAALYPEIAAKAIYVVPSGEEHKTIATVTEIWCS